MTTTSERAAARRRYDIGKRGLDEVDGRLGSSRFLTSVLDKIFPDHWSFMVGEIAMHTLVILILTGIYLALFYTPSGADIIYAPPGGHGYAPLIGQHMTKAYESTLNLSFNVRFGLIMRQAHHWAALIFLAAIMFHMARVFFTGAFRKPREINWIIGVTLFTIVMLEGYTGYSLPDDLLSGTGLRVVYSIIEGIPFVGTWLVYDLWGGRFPGSLFFVRLFVVHEFLFPAVIVGLLSGHLMILWRQKHTDFPGPGKTETNIRGSRIWPQYALKSGALLMLCGAATFLLGGLVQINPIWLYGPYNVYTVSAGSQPDWYLGWLDGFLRLWPHWEFRSFGHEIANPVFPGLLFPGLVFGIIYLWPWIDKKIYNDYGAHNLLDRPRDKPFRTGAGVAGILFFTNLTLACGDDLIANDLHVSFERIAEILRWSLFAVPLVGFFIAFKTCKALQRSDSHPIRRPIGSVIFRDVGGAYHSLGGPDHSRPSELARMHHGDRPSASAQATNPSGDGAPGEGGADGRVGEPHGSRHIS